MKKPRAGSPECGAIVASLPLSRTNRAILQQPFGFELTVPACLDSNQASATDPRPPNSSRTRRWHQCRAYTWGADHHADAPLLESLWDDPHASAEEADSSGASHYAADKVRAPTEADPFNRSRFGSLAMLLAKRRADRSRPFPFGNQKHCTFSKTSAF